MVQREWVSSWWVDSDSIAMKKLDKSSFLHRGTGIPIGITDFFHLNLEPGGRKIISLEFEGEEYRARIERDNSRFKRYRMFWGSSMSNILRETFPVHYQKFITDDKKGLPTILMVFESQSLQDRFQVRFQRSIENVDLETVKQDVEAEEVEQGAGTEGRKTEYYGNRYERNPHNRKKAIDIHGLSCVVCEFNFREAYGDRGKDWIEVHHIRPISSFKGEETVINPVTDLVPVCANCHRMIHRKQDNVLTIEEMKEVIVNNIKDEQTII